MQIFAGRLPFLDLEGTNVPLRLAEHKRPTKPEGVETRVGKFDLGSRRDVLGGRAIQETLRINGGLPGATQVDELGRCHPKECDIRLR